MYRAEKSSSKICRARELEKAQELHQKKIDGVKSYFTSKPAHSRTAAASRHRPGRSTLGNFSSVSNEQDCPPSSAGASLASSNNLNLQQATKDHEGDSNQKTTIAQQGQATDDFQRSLAKMEEFRGVEPVPGFGSVPPSKNDYVKFQPPPLGAKRSTMNGSFRARRLKEIKADNVEVFQRIRKSVSHYRNDDLRRDWQQNLSYLSSITEYPSTLDSSTHKLHITNDDDRNCFGPTPRRPSFLRTATRADALPSIPLPVVAHPIKSIPTFPKKLHLNMTPGFRSLRKAMPQQPSLPPIPSSHNTEPVKTASPSNQGNSQAPTDDRHAHSLTGRGLTSQSSTEVSSTTFIGDLHGKQAESEVSGDAKYQLLKIGRFVGGSYLVLTVFCGDGVTNPYGFDVFAYHGELQCEYKLHITKEMTHVLLERSSSSSLAAETEAAAGTNLSMQEIARSICDHINFAVLGADQGEMIFLVSAVGGKNHRAMRIDSDPALVAFCVHQSVELEALDSDDYSRNTRYRKRRAHVFASTCPATTSSRSVRAQSTDITISFQLADTLSTQRSSSSSDSASTGTALQVEVGSGDIFNNIIRGPDQDEHRMLSLDRMAIAAIRHLHVIAVPSGDDNNSMRNELILNSHVNTQLQPCPSHIATTLEKKRSRQQLSHSVSQTLSLAGRGTLLLQIGLIWSSVYLLAEVALDNPADPENVNKTQQRQLLQDISCDLVITVYNSNSGHSSCRWLSPGKVRSYVDRLAALPASMKPTTSHISDESVSEFAEQLLALLQLDVNLFGQEVIVFPALEHANPSPTEVGGGHNSTEAPQSPSRRLSESKEPHSLLPRKSSWVSDNISEGDEAEDDEDLDSEDGDMATEFSTGIHEFVSFEDEDDEDQTEDSYASQTNQNEADPDGEQHEDTPEEKEAATREEELVIEKLDSVQPEATTRPRQRRRGQKIDGRFCLTQGSPSDIETAATVIAIGALGTLELQ